MFWDLFLGWLNHRTTSKDFEGTKHRKETTYIYCVPFHASEVRGGLWVVSSRLSCRDMMRVLSLTRGIWTFASELPF